jgi:transposase-like protein|tara:strand:- start:78 stop:278 length:201 start_codon:yes stop_codon:yes gene_type:complete
MRKRRSRTYLKTLKAKAVKYYLENPNINLKIIADKFNITEQLLSKAITTELKKKFNNSFSRRMSSL